ncbi:MAG TPA: gliding motility-associated C-terminal domain-containing protein [Flavobacteriales bacterium]|nr:gliding motility-associated C-terminal domain-containing protein [Flavobacteriales bacterium]HPH82000.1 gliding motility-associated C-terminal domain-containing protein [Flavobacteriales bacterium]
MKKFLLSFLFLSLCLANTHIQAQSNCIDVMSILVNSCAPNGNGEGKNEMVRMRTGVLDLNIYDMNLTWPNTNLSWNGIVMDAGTAQTTAEFNATILSCGYLIEPLDGIIPAHHDVLLISSYNCNTSTNFFSQLGDTLYIVYANENTNTGHVLNYVPNANPNNQTLYVDFPTIGGCTEQVTYYRTQLITTAGNIGDEDGATVNFNIQGDATYINIGCVAPITPFSANWTAPNVCANSQPFNLNLLITGTTGGTWSGPGVTGNIFDPTGLSGSVDITYTVGAGSCSQSNTQTVAIHGAVSPNWTAPPLICSNAGTVDLTQYVSGTAGGTWSGQGVNGNNLIPTSLTGSITLTYTVGVSGCTQTESHSIQIQPINVNWVNPGTICSGNGTINLNDQLPNGVVGTWTGQNITDSIFDPTGLTGQVIITFSQDINGCSGSNTQPVTVAVAPDASWTNPGFICDLSTLINLDGLITGDLGGTWSGDGVTGSTFDPSLVVDSTVIRYGVSGNGCVSTVIQTIYIGTIPVLEVNGSDLFCSGGELTPFDVTALPGATISWFSDSQLTIQIGTGATYTPSGTGDQTVYVVQSLGDCTSEVSSFSYTIVPTPNSPITDANVNVCEGTAIPVLTATSTSNVYWFSDVDMQNLVQQGPTYQPTQTGITLWVIARENGCVSEPVVVQVNGLPLATVAISVTGPSTICHGSSVALQATSNISFVWSTGAQTNDLIVTQAGTYSVSASNSCNSATDQIVVLDLSPDASFDVSTLEGYAPLNLAVVPASSTGCDWYLNGSSTIISQNALLLENAGTYTLKQVCDNNGCMDSTSRVIVVSNGSFVLELPNSFTPNGDGYNDIFKAKSSGIVEFRSTIFDRWGQEIYTWEGAGNSWDGTKKGNPVSDGVYFYVIKGKDFQSNDFERYGSITLVRN